LRVSYVRVFATFSNFAWCSFTCILLPS